MKSRDLELASFYLFFDILILNLAIVFAGFIDVGFSLHKHTGLSIYLLQGNLSAAARSSSAQRSGSGASAQSDQRAKRKGPRDSTRLAG